MSSCEHTEHPEIDPCVVSGIYSFFFFLQSSSPFLTLSVWWLTPLVTLPSLALIFKPTFWLAAFQKPNWRTEKPLTLTVV